MWHEDAGELTAPWGPGLSHHLIGVGQTKLHGVVIGGHVQWRHTSSRGVNTFKASREVSIFTQITGHGRAVGATHEVDAEGVLQVFEEAHILQAGADTPGTDHVLAQSSFASNEH